MEDLQQQQNPNFLNFQSQLPNATAVLVLGIISIIGCFCYGLPGLICGIIALILANKDLQLYNTNPSVYTESSLNNLKAGKTCAIIGLILSALYFLVVLVVVIIAGAGVLSNPQNFIR